MTPNFWITGGIVLLTFIGVAIGRYPIIKSNRTTIALMGVALLLVTRQVQFEQLPDYIDFDTIILLFSMMIINANLKLAGFFSVASQWLVRWSRSAPSFLAVEILLAGVLSALFLNDTICLMFAPFLINLMDTMKRNPIPYLIALATAANVGSTATLTGNPQNMIVGIASGISYTDFSLALIPVALVGLGVIWLVLVKMFPFDFDRRPLQVLPEQDIVPVQKPLLIKTLLITGGLLVAFLGGAPIALSSFLAASLLLITRRHQPQTVFAEFDWSLLVFFSALFIVSGSLETSGVTTQLIDVNTLADRINIWNLSLLSAGLSNLVSNVPAVLLLKPLVSALDNARIGWLTLASASTLAGNLTLLGSVANLIVAETASRYRIDLSFWKYTKPGFVITLITLAIDIAWLYLIA
ncbi:MAG TPA: anion transporter [Anaerolineaceae bacterium]|nr:anion transporter [Anaerolineaceae bacterium]